jgi:hypothetical protein
VALLALPTSVPALRDAAHSSRHARARLEQTRAALDAETFASRHPLFSDTPDFVAWTLDRPVVWLTRDEHRALPVCGASPSGDPRDRPCREAAAADLPGAVWFQE